MKLAYIELAGFRGVKNRLRLDVPTGFLVITGRNGSGKSTVCDAINFALTGAIREQGHKENGETYSDYLWWRGAGSASERFVKLGFQDAQGSLFEVIRTDDGLDPKSKEILKLLYNHDGAPDRPLHALACTSLLRDEEITSLSVDLPESDRYKFVRDALGTVDLADIDYNLVALKKRIDERVRKDQQLYGRLRDKISDLTSRLSDLRGSKSSTHDDQSIEKEIRLLLDLPDGSLTELLEFARKRLVWERKRLDRLHQLHEKLQRVSSLKQIVGSKQHTERWSELEGNVTDLETQFVARNRECEELESQVERAKLQEPNRIKHAQLCDLGESIGLPADTKCPLCGSEVSKQEFENHIMTVRDEIKAESSGVVAVVAQQREALVKRKETQTALDFAKQQLTQHLVKNTELADLIDTANKEASSENIPVSNKELSSERVLSEIETIRDVIRRIENGVGWIESSSVTEMIQSHESELGDLKEQANEAYATASRSEKATAKIKEAQKNTKSLLGEIIDEQLAELSPLIEELYKRLRPHVEWTHIKYRLRGDVRRMLSFEVGKKLNPSFMFSSGQRRASGLAFLLAVHLSRPWCNFESLVLDDPVQHVDDFRALNLTELLTSIRKDGRQILCCVEDEALGQLMCRRLRSGTDTDGRFIRMQYDCESGVTKVDDLEIGPSQQQILVPA